MESTRELGKIASARVGYYGGRFGLHLAFTLGGGSSVVGHSLTVTRDDDRAKISRILQDAKVEYIDQLAGKPVEVVMKNEAFSSFRVLTEVI